jgi:hypothetical protein
MDVGILMWLTKTKHRNQRKHKDSLLCFCMNVSIYDVCHVFAFSMKSTIHSLTQMQKKKILFFCLFAN